jgi:hypothetical protein
MSATSSRVNMTVIFERRPDTHAKCKLRFTPLDVALNGEVWSIAGQPEGHSESDGVTKALTRRRRGELVRGRRSEYEENGIWGI